MLLQNFCTMAANIMPSNSNGTQNNAGYVRTEAKTLGGATNYAYFYNASNTSGISYLSPKIVSTNNTSSTSSMTVSRAGLVFGSGTTPPAYTDFSLENKITSGFNYDSGSFTRNSMGVITCTATITNTSGSDLTINEIGLRISNQFSDNQTGSAYIALLTRDVLDTPVVLANNETKTFTVTINTALFSTGHSVS